MIHGKPIVRAWHIARAELMRASNIFIIVIKIIITITAFSSKSKDPSFCLLSCFIQRYTSMFFGHLFKLCRGIMEKWCLHL